MPEGVRHVDVAEASGLLAQRVFAPGHRLEHGHHGPHVVTARAEEQERLGGVSQHGLELLQVGHRGFEFPGDEERHDEVDVRQGVQHPHALGHVGQAAVPALPGAVVEHVGRLGAVPEEDVRAAHGHDGFAAAGVEREALGRRRDGPVDQPARHPHAHALHRRTGRRQELAGPVVVGFHAHRLQEAAARGVDGLALLRGQLLEAHAVLRDQDILHQGHTLLMLRRCPMPAPPPPPTSSTGKPLTGSKRSSWVMRLTLASLHPWVICRVPRQKLVRRHHLDRYLEGADAGDDAHEVTVAHAQGGGIDGVHLHLRSGRRPAEARDVAEAAVQVEQLARPRHENEGIRPDRGSAGTRGSGTRGARRSPGPSDTQT